MIGFCSDLWLQELPLLPHFYSILLTGEQNSAKQSIFLLKTPERCDVVHIQATWWRPIHTKCAQHLQPWSTDIAQKEIFIFLKKQTHETVSDDDVHLTNL